VDRLLCFGDLTLELFHPQCSEVESHLVGGEAKDILFVGTVGLAIWLRAEQDEAVELTVMDAGQCEFPGQRRVRVRASD